MEKTVHSVTVRTDESERLVWIVQEDPGTEASSIMLSPDQVPLLIEHLSEACREFDSIPSGI